MTLERSSDRPAPLPPGPDALPVLDWQTLTPQMRQQTLQRPVQQVAAQTRDTVAAIIAQVRDEGDAALRALSARFDPVALQRFEVTPAEFEAAEEDVSPALRAAMHDAMTCIERYHRAGMLAPYRVETAQGVLCQRIQRPIGAVGLYVPAGSAPLPSTALMLGVPARLAGCPQVVMCTPPRNDGRADSSVLVAARLCGIDKVFKIGGAQAVAAMALGTTIVPGCYKLFGPGNSYVTEAKRQLAASDTGVAIDMPAGPSEVLIIADAGADPALVAADLLSQAEHGADSQVILISDAPALVAAVNTHVLAQLPALPRMEIARQALAGSRALLVADLLDAFDISNQYAPEHLILALRDPSPWLEHVQAAGSVFLGDWSAEALGDYCSGTNHVLPTSGAARAWSGVSVASFQTSISVQTVQPSGIAAIGPTAMTLAEAEGLHAHANAVRLRLQRLPENAA